MGVSKWEDHEERFLLENCRVKFFCPQGMQRVYILCALCAPLRTLRATYPSKYYPLSRDVYLLTCTHTCKLQMNCNHEYLENTLNMTQRFQKKNYYLY